MSELCLSELRSASRSALLCSALFWAFCSALCAGGLALFARIVHCESAVLLWWCDVQGIVLAALLFLTGDSFLITSCKCFGYYTLSE